MIATIRAEFVKLLRRRVLVITAVITAVFSVASAAIVLISADAGVRRVVSGRGVTVESLSNAGGGTDVFTTAVSFAGVFVFVVIIGLFAMEFSRGTFRTMLMYQPRRIRLLAGKLTALLAFSAAVLAVAELITWVAARILAPTQDVATGSWVSADALGQAISDYGSVLFWVSGYAVLGTAIAVIVRSVPLSLAIGIAWAGPFEHIVQDAWGAATRFFPGLLLEAFVAGGTPDVSARRALVTVAVYLAIAAAIAGTTFARRDVTA
jgi:ABC-type transport system involved in multi-copper enzyme maturation permease subunit